MTLPPVAMETPAAIAARPPVDVGAPGGRLLIVDDEPMILGALRRSFSSDYHVTCVGDGRRALERIRAGERYDVILCDLMMPEITGMDLYAELGRLAPDQVERIVFVTGGAFTPRAREFLESIPNARVEKPIDFQNLKLLLRNLRSRCDRRYPSGMLIGVPKEIKTREYRVAITPAGVRQLVAHGHRVLVEHTAGEGSGITDEQYVAAGATIVPGAADAWGAEMVVKVKEPLAAEYGYFREGLILYTYLHLAAEPALTRELAKAKVAAVAYETIETADGRLPLLRPMSEVAGRMAVQVARSCLEKERGGKGVLLGGVPGHAARARGHPGRRRRRAQRRHHRHRHGRVT